MPEEDDERKFWRRRNPFFDLFSDFDRMDEMMDEMMREAFEDFDRVRRREKPLVYGFSIKVGPEGKPIIQEFGDIKPSEEKLKVKDMREPLVDVIEREKEIDVLAELPGVEKNDINLEATEDILEIDVPNQFYKKIKLPAKIKKGDVKAKYKNGVLTVTLIKQKPTEKKGIKIE